jgi:hypothetical protein
VAFGRRNRVVIGPDEDLQLVHAGLVTQHKRVSIQRKGEEPKGCHWTMSLESRVCTQSKKSKDGKLREVKKMARMCRGAKRFLHMEDILRISG